MPSLPPPAEAMFDIATATHQSRQYSLSLPLPSGTMFTVASTTYRSHVCHLHLHRQKQYYLLLPLPVGTMYVVAGVTRELCSLSPLPPTGEIFFAIATAGRNNVRHRRLCELKKQCLLSPPQPLPAGTINHCRCCHCITNSRRGRPVTCMG